MPNSSLWIVLPLNPEPWRVGPLSVIRRGGKYIPTMGRDQQLNAYKEAVKETVLKVLPDDFIMSNGSKNRLTIYLWRNRASYMTPQARTHRKHEADATNMLKATEDALQDILYKNDKDNSEVRCVIMEQGEFVVPCIIVHFEPYVPEVIPVVPDAVREAWIADRAVALWA